MTRTIDFLLIKMYEALQQEQTDIAYAGYYLEKARTTLPADVTAELEKYIHHQQVCSFNRMSTLCADLQMSAKDYAALLDGIPKRDRDVLRRFLVQDPFIVNNYPADYLLAIRRLAS